MMCCSSRAAVYFMSSNHLYFAVSQVILPMFHMALRNFGTNSAASSLTVGFCVAYFASGFLIFFGADKESTTLIRFGGHLLALSLTFRFFILGFSMILSETLPEATFLYVYNTQVVPIIFIVVVYIFYLSVVFCYHNELADEALRSLRGTSNTPRLYHFKSPRLDYDRDRPLQANMIASTSFFEE